jgi:hypothetical protein
LSESSIESLAEKTTRTLKKLGQKVILTTSIAIADSGIAKKLVSQLFLPDNLERRFTKWQGFFLSSLRILWAIMLWCSVPLLPLSSNQRDITISIRCGRPNCVASDNLNGRGRMFDEYLH